MPVKPKHIVIVGDATVGKTWFLHSYSNKSFLEDYVPIVYENKVFDLSFNGQAHTIQLFDTDGHEGYELVRRVICKDADCLLLCYDISNRTSFTNISQKWLPELRAVDNWPIPIVLVATKIDLRQGSLNPLISTEEGEDLCRKIHAKSFVECSAKDNINIEQTIHEAIRAMAKVEETRTEKRKSFFGSCSLS